MGKLYPASGRFDALAFCDEHCVNIHADCGRKLAYCFKQVLNLLVVIAQDHDIADIALELYFLLTQVTRLP